MLIKAFWVSVKPHWNERLYTHTQTQSKNERNSLFEPIFHIPHFSVSHMSLFLPSLRCFPLLFPLSSFLLVTCPSVCDILGERHVYGPQGSTNPALSFRASPQSCPLKTLHHYTLITKAEDTDRHAEPQTHCWNKGFSHTHVPQICYYNPLLGDYHHTLSPIAQPLQRFQTKHLSYFTVGVCDLHDISSSDV